MYNLSTNIKEPQFQVVDQPVLSEGDLVELDAKFWGRPSERLTVLRITKHEFGFYIYHLGIACVGKEVIDITDTKRLTLVCPSSVKVVVNLENLKNRTKASIQNVGKVTKFQKFLNWLNANFDNLFEKVI